MNGIVELRDMRVVIGIFIGEIGEEDGEVRLLSVSSSGLCLSVGWTFKVEGLLWKKQGGNVQWLG
jgi:hypothetical protein